MSRLLIEEYAEYLEPLDMLLEEKLAMWKEKENDSMDEGAQEDEQFEVEKDNGKTVGSENSRQRGR